MELNNKRRTLAFVRQMHAGQVDLANKSYAFHPIAVAKMLEMRVENPNFDLILAGLGHDLKEDTKATTEQMLAAGFSPRSIEIIDLVTKQNYPTDATYQQRIELLIKSGDIDAMLLKLFDNTHNLDPSRLSQCKLRGDKWESLVSRYHKSSRLLIIALEGKASFSLPAYMGDY